MKITTFYNEEYLQSASYVSFRMLSSVVDGFKNGARKIIYTVDKHNIYSDIKVSQLGSKVAEETSYLHGEQSLYGAIVALAQTFAGSNNLNMLQPEGNFGNRFIQEAAAGRYIYTRKSKYFDLILHKDDRDILINQTFEGEQIEHKYYVPIVPLILINGSEGIGNGFAQKIFQRDEKEIIKILEDYLKGKKFPKSIGPKVKGFGGSINLLEDGKLQIVGSLQIVNTNTIKITDVPFTYDLQGYLKVLTALEDKKIIKGFIDKSENDVYEFEIDCTRDFVSKTTKEEFLEIFKLVKKVTENFTCIDENNAVIEFENEIQLLQHYIKIRLNYYSLRKKSLLEKLKSNQILLSNRVAFIKGIVDGTIIVGNKTKTEIEKQLIKAKIKKIEDSYEYLYKMSIYSLTKEKYEELSTQLESNIKSQTELESKTENQLWLTDLEELKKHL